MAVAAILVIYRARVIRCGRHMIQRLAARSHPVAGLAVVHDAGMILECTRESVSVVAIAAIGIRCRVRRSRGLADGIDAVVAVVTVGAGLRCRIDHSVIEYPAHAECRDTVADSTIDPDARMTDRRSRGIDVVMAGITPLADNVRSRVVGIGGQKAGCRMAVAAFGFGRDVSIMLANSYSTVVTAAAYPGNARMVEAAVRCQLQKRRGVVAVVAFRVRREMKLGFADSHDTVVALAAVAEHFLVVDDRNDVKSLGRMAGLAQIAGSDVRL